MANRGQESALHGRLTLLVLLALFRERHKLKGLAEYLECSETEVLGLAADIESTGAAKVAISTSGGEQWIRLTPGLALKAPHMGYIDTDAAKLALCHDILVQLVPDALKLLLADVAARLALVLRDDEK